MLIKDTFEFEFYTMSNLSYLHKLKKTPLHIAIENKNCEIVQELLDHHSNIRAFDVKNTNSITLRERNN